MAFGGSMMVSGQENRARGGKEDRLDAVLLCNARSALTISIRKREWTGPEAFTWDSRVNRVQSFKVRLDVLFNLAQATFAGPFALWRGFSFWSRLSISPFV
jgi:hypothetical protein